MENEKKEESNYVDFKLRHEPSPNFISDHATGAALSGPTNDGLFYLVFFSDAVKLKHETGKFIRMQTGENGISTPIFSLDIDTQDDLENFREDKVRIALSMESILSLRDLLNRRFPDQG